MRKVIRNKSELFMFVQCLSTLSKAQRIIIKRTKKKDKFKINGNY